MTPNALRRLVQMHAETLLSADRCEQRAARMERSGEVERAECERDDATMHRARAAALAMVLEPHGVTAPDARQLSLLSDGGSAE